MNKEFEKLYTDWYKATCFMSHSLFDVTEWKQLVDWSKEHKEEAVDGLIEILEQEPDWVVQLCDELFTDTVKYDGFVPLDFNCRLWLTLLKKYKKGESFNGTDIYDCPDPYKVYDEYHEYLKENYIPWNPFHEEDPNITLEEFKQGKRNPKKK